VLAPAVLLVRFGSLGDVVLACAAGQALAAQRPELAITFLVKREYAEIVEAQPWAGAVWALEPGDERGAAALKGWRERVRRLRRRRRPADQPRSRALLRAPARAPLERARWQRRRWVSLRWTHPRPCARVAALRRRARAARRRCRASPRRRVSRAARAVARAQAMLATWPAAR
jgi:ADP-heptose:LPS heptosyltransferase